MVLPNLALVNFFRKLKDPRSTRRRRHFLLDIIAIAICAVIAGCDDWQQIESTCLPSEIGHTFYSPAHHAFFRPPLDSSCSRAYYSGAYF